MTAFVPELPVLARRYGVRVAKLTTDLCPMAAAMDWTHHDPFDRIIAATARAEGAALVSADTAFDAIPAGNGRVARVW